MVEKWTDWLVSFVCFLCHHCEQGRLLLYRQTRKTCFDFFMLSALNLRIILNAFFMTC